MTDNDASGSLHGELREIVEGMRFHAQQSEGESQFDNGFAHGLRIYAEEIGQTLERYQDTDTER